MGNYILCPYYKRDRKRSISCEDTIRLYPTSKEKNGVLKRLCSSRWKECPYAQAMDRIYQEDLPYQEIKEKIMENKIEQMEAEINKLMRENGQLQRKLKVYEEQITERDKASEKNHRMYMMQLNSKDDEIRQLKENVDKKIQEMREKSRLLVAKGKQVEWLESLAAAVLVVAYGDKTREVHMSKGKVMKLMTEYKLEQRYDEKTDCFIFNIEHNVKGEKS